MTVAVDAMKDQFTDISNTLFDILHKQSGTEKALEDLIQSKGGKDAVMRDDAALLEITIKFPEKEAWEKGKGKDEKETPKTLDAGLKLELSASLEE